MSNYVNNYFIMKNAFLQMILLPVKTATRASQLQLELKRAKDSFLKGLEELYSFVYEERDYLELSCSLFHNNLLHNSVRA